MPSALDHDLVSQDACLVRSVVLDIGLKIVCSWKIFKISFTSGVATSKTNICVEFDINWVEQTIKDLIIIQAPQACSTQVNSLEKDPPEGHLLNKWIDRRWGLIWHCREKNLIWFWSRKWGTTRFTTGFTVTGATPLFQSRRSRNVLMVCVQRRERRGKNDLMRVRNDLIVWGQGRERRERIVLIVSFVVALVDERTVFRFCTSVLFHQILRAEMEKYDLYWTFMTA